MAKEKVNNKEMDAIYSLNGKINPLKAFPFGLQHILAMFVANITPIIIVAGASGLSTKDASNAILGAAIIDDVLGIIALTIITSFKSKDVNIWFVLIKIVLFFIFAAILGFIMLKIYKWMNKHILDHL